jgi:hypothetical protein
MEKDFDNWNKRKKERNNGFFFFSPVFPQEDGPKAFVGVV